MQKGVCGHGYHGGSVTSREEQSGSDRRLQVCRHGLWGLLTDDRQGVEITAVAHTRSEGDNALGTRRELLQLVAHQLNDVVGERGRGNDLRIVCPATPVGIE